MSLLRQTLRLAIPAMLENLFISSVFLIDALMVASLGPAQLAATGLGGVVMWRLISMSGVLRIGIGAATARRWGEGRFGAACDMLSHGIVLSFAAGLIVIGIMFPLAPYLFRAMQARGAVLFNIIPYFQIIVLILPMRLASINMGSSLRAAGNTRTPMVITLITNIINVALNYVMIFGHLGFPALGILGAALASFISLMGEFLIFTALGIRGMKATRVFKAPAQTIPPEPGETDSSGGEVLRFTRRGLRFVLPNATRTILRVSHPSFWEEVGITFGFLVFFAMISSFGEMALAAHTAIVRIESFSFLAAFGISIAAATLIGQALGAGNIADARRSFWLCIMLGSCIMGVMGIIFCLFPGWFLGWFVSPGGDFRDIGIPLLIIIAVEQPFIGMGMVLANGLRGAGQTTAPFVAQFTGVVLVRISLSYFFGFTLGWGLQGLYLATIFDWLVRTALLGWLVMQRKWEKAVV